MDKFWLPWRTIFVQVWLFLDCLTKKKFQSLFFIILMELLDNVVNLKGE